jgi:argininosuccinate lyase
VSADLATLLSLTSGLPLAYHRDLQETRRAMFDAVASLRLCGEVLTGAVSTLEFNRDAMRQAAARGHALATALAERLVRAGVPFRAAHQRVGRLVADAEQAGCDLAQLPDGVLREALPELAELITVMPTLEEAVAAADVHGGTAPHRVRAALQLAQERLAAR